MYLGVHGILAKSFARIHKANLINFGLIPLVIDNDTYDRIDEGDNIQIVEDAVDIVRSGDEAFTIRLNDELEATAHLDASSRERQILADGGKLPYTKKR